MAPKTKPTTAPKITVSEIADARAVVAALPEILVSMAKKHGCTPTDILASTLVAGIELDRKLKAKKRNRRAAK